MLASRPAFRSYEVTATAGSGWVSDAHLWPYDHSLRDCVKTLWSDGFSVEALTLAAYA